MIELLNWFAQGERFGALILLLLVVGIVAELIIRAWREKD